MNKGEQSKGQSCLSQITFSVETVILPGISPAMPEENLLTQDRKRYDRKEENDRKQYSQL